MFLVLEYFFRTTSPGGVCSLWPPLQVVEYFYNHLLQVGSLASPGLPLPLLPVLTRHYRELAGYVEFLIFFIIMGGPTHILDVGPMGSLFHATISVVLCSRCKLLWEPPHPLNWTWGQWEAYPCKQVICFPSFPSQTQWRLLP